MALLMAASNMSYAKMQSSAFKTGPASSRVMAPIRQRSVRVQAVAERIKLRQYPDPDFIEEVAEAFPDKGVATVEEGRVLFSSLGYTYLDVRPALELEEVGKVRGCVNIPIVNSKKMFKDGKKVIQKADNPDFIKMIKKRFPDLESKIMVACSDGKAYSMDALEALDDEGYVNIVGLRGGYYAWFKVFDNKLNRRNLGEFQENYNHDGDSCGIHSSGAGFKRVDAIEKWVPPTY